jgi:hypothetical protein
VPVSSKTQAKVQSKAGSSKKKEEAEEEGDQQIVPMSLRSYELNKLKYFFAVIECDSVETATLIYTSCDGVEFENSSNLFDLRFVPDDTDFSDRKARDECSAFPEDYAPVDFYTPALQASKLELSWDLDDPRRKRVLNYDSLKALTSTSNGKSKSKSRKGKGRNEAKYEEDLLDEKHGKFRDLKAYLASDDEDGSESGGDVDEDDDEHRAGGSRGTKDRRAMLLAVLRSGGGEDEEGVESDGGDEDMAEKTMSFVPEMHKSFNDALAKKSKSGTLNSGGDDNKETLWEAFLKKKSEKKKEKRLQKQLRVEGDDRANVDPDDFFVSSAEVGARSANSRKKPTKKPSPEDGDEIERSTAGLELLWMDTVSGRDGADDGADGDDADGGYRKKKLSRKEKKKAKKESKKLSSMTEQEVLIEASKPDTTGFKLNAHDERFASKIASNPSFAIDPTSSQFKDTIGMKAWTQKQSHPHSRKDRPMVTLMDSVHSSNSNISAQDNDSVSKLAEKIKSKFVRPR